MARLSKAVALVIALALLPALGGIERLFAPKADLWPKWQAHDPGSHETIGHASWDALLARYVRSGNTGVNLVDYRGFASADRTTLTTYIDSLASVQISKFNRDEQLAYWINLYNALTVKVVLDHFPVDSIRDIDISPGIFSKGPWGKDLVTVEGQKLSLNDIEHRILRPIWRDPRIHYTVNCASIGCPNLGTNAYRGAGIDQALTEAAKGYVNDKRGVEINGGKVTVSKIYDWFIKDFGGSEASVIRHLQQYAKSDLSTRLATIGKIDDTHYDWSLNMATP